MKELNLDKLKCIKCERSFECDEYFLYDGIYEKVTGGYGSTYDMSQFMIAICDNCLTSLKEKEIIIQTRDFKGFMTEPINEFKGHYRFLSNFYPSQVEMDGHFYPTVEHAYQAAKTLDDVERFNIRKATTPSMAKSMGKSVKLRKDWNQIKLQVMENLLRQKFDSDINPELSNNLFNTHHQELIEGNYWGDTFWGVCNGKGENHLGKLLMKIRDNQKEEFFDEMIPLLEKQVKELEAEVQKEKE
jgi:ribA/ribD-fused uncharacterized protein